MQNESTKVKPAGERRFPTKGHADETDVLIGEKIRIRRSRLALSQAKLGTAVGLTFQQIQKYERGINRVSASTLLDIADALGVDVGYFYEGLMPGDTTTLAGGKQSKYTPAGRPVTNDPEEEDLLTLFRGVGNNKHRRQILELARSFAEASSESGKKA